MRSARRFKAAVLDKDQDADKDKDAGAAVRERQRGKVGHVVAEQDAIREKMRLKGSERRHADAETPDGERRDIYGAYLDADKEAQRRREAEADFAALRRQERRQQRAAQARIKEHRRKLKG